VFYVKLSETLGIFYETSTRFCLFDSSVLLGCYIICKVQVLTLKELQISPRFLNLVINKCATALILYISSLSP